MINNQPIIYFPFVNKPVTGGDYVNVDHINLLNQLGINAKALFFNQYFEYTRANPQLVNEFTCPATLFTDNIIFSENDIFVIGEVQNFISKANLINGTPIKNVILHNQNPFLTYYGFSSAKEINQHPLKTIIVPTDYTRIKLEEMGIKNKEFKVIYPYIPDYFEPKEKIKSPIKIVFSARKRRSEVEIVLFYFRSFYNDAYHINFVNLEGLSREQVAKEMSDAAIYLSFAERESLGLMLLEAMASGCHVIGFSGFTDLHNMELFNHSHAEFIEEGDYKNFAIKIIEAINQFINNEENEKVNNASTLIANRFRRYHFEDNLKRVYSEILGMDLL